MSCDIDSDSFHGTKKGGTRKTVSKRKAYVNTPLAIAKKLMEIADDIDSQKYLLAYSKTVQFAEKLSGKKRWDIR